MKFFTIILLFFSFDNFGQDNDEQLKITQLSENVYQHTSYKEIGSWGMVAASGLVVVDGINAHIIDTPWTLEDTEKLISWIRSKNLIVTSSVVTHFHPDASGGISLLNNTQIKTYATTLTNKLLSQKNRERSSVEIPTDTFELVNNTIEVFYPGAGHTQDNIVVWLPKEEILFGGCFVKSKKSNNLGNIEDAIVKDWPQSIQNVLNKYPNIKVVVPGHGKIGDVTLLNHTAELALRLKEH
jgi:glyoxylase-like metal-dependent hydrolase (beta-lactamase superfamily II)